MTPDDQLPQDFSEFDDLEPMIAQDEDYRHGRPLLSFTGPSDLPKEENRRWFLLVITISILFIFVALLTQAVILALILILVAWLTYMLTRLPNQDIENIVTTTGFFTQGKFYSWSQVSAFGILKDHGHYVLALETDRRAFSSVMILLGSQNPLEVKRLLAQYVPYHEDYHKDSLTEWMDNIAILLDRFYSAIGAGVKNRMNARKTSGAETMDESTEEEPVSAPAAFDEVDKEPISTEEYVADKQS